MNTTKQNPYVGPRTFLKEEGHLFFGREREASDLIALVASEQLVLFYAQSGAGKSSLINTRLIPYLESKDYEVLPVSRVSGAGASGIETDNIYIFNLFHNLDQHETDFDSLGQLSLTDFLGNLNRDESGYFYDDSPLQELPHEEALASPPRRALIIDQFEELFSTHPEAWEKREDFFHQLSQAMREDLYLWVVLVMREDYIAALDPYAHLMPNGLRVRYYMQRLGRESALKAIKNPVLELRPYAEGVAERLVEDLSSIKVQKPDGTPDFQAGQYVEPVQLQVVCYGLWENLPPEGTDITEKDLLEVGDVDQSLAKYYEGRVQSVAQAKNVKERLIREWFGKKLITSGGIRNLVLQERNGKSDGLDDEVIQAFQSDLVRAEQRGGATWYELTHDRLVKPIIANNETWFNENLSPLQRQAALWKDQEQNESWLLRGQALTEVKQWEKDHQAELTDTEKEFLEASRLLVEREQRAKRLNRLIAILGIVAIVLAIIAYQANLLARHQARVAFIRQLAAQSDTTLKEFPARSLLLGIEANTVTQPGEQRLASAEEALRAALKQPHGLPLSGHAGPVNTLAFSPDGHWLATGSDDQTVHLWDMNAAGKDSKLFKLTSQGTINVVAFSPEGHWLAAAGSNGAALVWDLTAVDPSIHPKILSGHDLDIHGLAFSPDGHWLATGSQDETAQLWDLTAPDLTKAARVLNVRYGWIQTLAFSPDGNWLATGGGGGTALLWDLRVADPDLDPIELPGHLDPILTLAFSADGHWLATGSADKTAQLWDITKLKTLQPPEQPWILHLSDKVNILAFRPQTDHGHWLATGSEDGTVQLWDLDALNPAANPLVLAGHTGAIKTLGFSPDGSWLATGSLDHTVRVWDMIAEVPAVNPKVFSGHDGSVNALAFSPNGRWLASGSQDGSVRLWDQINSDPSVNPIVLKGHSDDINNLAFSPDGRWLASASSDNTARLWGWKGPNPTGKFIVLSGHTGGVEPMAFSRDGHWLATGSGDKTTRLWDLRTSEPAEHSYELGGHTEWINAVAFSPDGHWLASGSADDTVQLWDLSSGKPASSPIVLKGHGGDIAVLAFSPDGHWLATGSADNTTRLWDMSATDQPVSQFVLSGHKDNVFTLAFSPDGRWLATGSGGGPTGVLLWGLKTSDPSSNLKGLPGHTGRVNALAFSPDSHWLATGSWDGTTRLWNLKDADAAARPMVLRGHLGKVNTLAFSPDGHWLATGSADNSILLWDLNSPAPTQEQVHLSDNGGEIKALAFSPDSRWLATGGKDNNIRLWLIPLNELENLACGIAGRNLTEGEWAQYFTGKPQKTCKQWP